MEIIQHNWKILSVVIGIYFLPTICSLLNKKSRSFPIFIFNLLLGWTVVGWISIFFEAFRDRRSKRDEFLEHQKDGVEEIFDSEDADSGVYVGVTCENGITIFSKNK